MSTDAQPERTKARRVAFVVPGYGGYCCGVTDYAFWLIGAAAEEGWEVLVLTAYALEWEHYRNRMTPQARARVLLAARSEHDVEDWSTRMVLWQRELATFQPDWISLQFSPPVFRQGRWWHRHLRAACAVLQAWPVAVTVHETWEPWNDRQTLRSRLESVVRRAETWSATRGLRPCRVWASNPIHAREVAKIGWPAQVLPIISTIHRRAERGEEEMRAVVAAAGVELKQWPREAFTALFFGRIRPDWPGEGLLRAIVAAAMEQGKKPVILSVGFMGYQDAAWPRLVAAAAGARCLALGRQPEALISRFLAAADVGICPTPLRLWSKSSTCHAMIVHGLPVAFADEDLPVEGALPPVVGLLRDGRVTWCKLDHDRVARAVNASEVWTQMNASMAGAGKGRPAP